MDGDLYWTKEEIDEWIDGSWAELWDMIAKADPDRWMSSHDFTIVAGTESYALPADFYEVKDVWVEDSTADTGWTRMQYIEPAKLHNVGRSSSSKTSTCWYVQGGYLWLHPNPGWNGTVRMRYQKPSTDWADDTTEYDVISRLHLEWMICDGLIKAAHKDDDDPAAKRAQWKRDRVEGRLLGQPRLQKAGPHKGTNVHA